MRRSRNVRRRGMKPWRKCALVFITCLLLMCFALILIIKNEIEPNMEDVARIKAEVLVSRTINKALAEQFGNSSMKSNLFTVQSGSDGSMEMVQADSAAINIFMSQLSVNLQESFQSMKNEVLNVPLGTLLGNKFLSQTGPFVEIAIKPLSVSSMDFKTEFETQGINQTKYKIYIVLGCKVKIAAPFSSKTFNTRNTILIAEAVILGKVPDSFVQVPKEDILDVTDE